MPSSDGDVTQLLARLNRGEADAREAVLEAVYQELRALAAGYLKRERPDHTLQPTALVHEAYLRLVGPPAGGFESRGHFLAIAATAMRRVLVDHARGHRRLKRGGERRRVPLDDVVTAAGQPDLDLVALDEALGRLAVINPRKVQVVELRFFAGLTNDEAAEALGTSVATVKRDWDFARSWLLDELENDG